MSGILPMLRAITSWNGPAEIKHLLLTLCSLSDHATGKGIHGQETIAEAMGRPKNANGARTVRRLLDRLEYTSSPVRVRRRARMRTDGKGRTSDEWTLYLAEPTGQQCPVGNDQPDTRDRLDLQPTGHEDPLSGNNQPDTQSGPTGLLEHDQPDTGVRGSELVNQNLLSELDLASAAPPPVTAPTFSLEPPKEKEKKPKGDHVEHKHVKAHYFSEFKRLRGTEPTWGPAQGRATNELIGKLKGDVDECRRRITNGLSGWNKATILSIAGDPDKCISADIPTPRGTRKGPTTQQGFSSAFDENVDAFAEPRPAKVVHLPVRATR